MYVLNLKKKKRKEKKPSDIDVEKEIIYRLLLRPKYLP